MSRRNTVIQQDASLKVTKHDLQQRWKQMELKTSTLLHLQELLDRRGIIAAVTVTDVLMREKQPRPKMVTLGKEWGFEELRLISLEGIRPHLIDVIRLAIETFITWHVFRVPESTLDGIVEIVLAVLFCFFAVTAVWVICFCRRKGQVSRRRGLFAFLRRMRSMLHKTQR